MSADAVFPFVAIGSVIVIYGLIGAVFFAGLYFTVYKAVARGMREALASSAGAATPPVDRQTEQALPADSGSR